MAGTRTPCTSAVVLYAGMLRPSNHHRSAGVGWDQVAVSDAETILGANTQGAEQSIQARDYDCT